ncbi:Peptidase S33 tripeptidyl aminopeptidase-lik [Beauveria brongniartii RCEF 3172]|uniref:Peptidase S33 tripeptidyl aminopeptidase-lik n=1 Tax=Beauveria brongniartii RCEF 3172 TaxID=1081107 RepID=A0A167A9X4_9HYPO|nr:Peptidase S33 tripeptidyl aminopeptidase-lik [Beauveria brongniartii RCEF 3172]
MKPLFCAALGLAAGAAASEFDWDAITPSHDLEYHDCYDNFRCARLLLPLDWLDDSASNKTVALALLKSDAVVGIDDATYAGPVLSNPGGPGGSGVDHLRGAVAKLRDMVDTPGKKHFEYVSFDPRGVGRTTPQVNCYPDGRLPRSAAIWKARGSGGVNGGGPAALPYNLGLETIKGNRCEDFNGDLLRYVGTTSVARDMLAVVEKIDEYNTKHSKRDKKPEKGDQMQLRSSSGTEKAKTGLPRLQYLGFSYGTVLGNYFASMFPDRIGRVLLDGVADIDDYGWLANTVDTDEMADLFFQGCFDAGPDICPLHRSGDSSGADISQRFWDWVDGLDQAPSFVTKKDQAVVVLQSGDLRTLLLGAMYQPLTLFKEAASLVDAAMRGNTTALYDVVSPIAGGSLDEACPVGGNGTASSADDSPDAQSAILCGDGEDVTGRDTAFWRAYVAKQLAQSSVAGAFWSSIRLACSSWRAQAKWQFRGPFTTPSPSDNNASAPPEPGRPAAPVLFLSNRLDPVTPLRSARKVAQMHPGAGLLVQDAMGHCVFSAHPPTDCTRRVVRRYFDEGVVPAEETTCEAVCKPWSECESAKRSVGALSSKDGRRRRDWRFPLHI